MDREKSGRFKMWDLARLLYKAIGPESPRTFIIVCAIIGALVGWVIVREHQARLKEQTPSVQSLPGSSQTTYGPQSPIMPDNSGVVNITNENGQSTSGQAKKGTEKHAQKTKKDKAP